MEHAGDRMKRRNRLLGQGNCQATDPYQTSAESRVRAKNLFFEKALSRSGADHPWFGCRRRKEGFPRGVAPENSDNSLLCFDLLLERRGLDAKLIIHLIESD